MKLLKFQKSKFCSFKENKKVKSTLLYQNYINMLAKQLAFNDLMYTLIDDKIYHYTILKNANVNELTCLKRTLKNNKEYCNQLALKYDMINKPENTIKKNLINSLTMLMGYNAFVDLLKVAFEIKEDQMNNIISDVYNDEYKEFYLKDSDALIFIRDKWRDCLEPDILDERGKPLRKHKLIDQANLNINSYILKALI